MSHGIAIHGENGNLVVDDSSIIYEYVGKYSMIEDRMPAHNQFTWVQSALHSWTHYVDLYNLNSRPLIFMALQTGPAVGVTGAGAAIIGVKYFENAGNPYYRVYMVVTVGESAPDIRVFTELKQPTNDDFGMHIYRADGSIVFDSNKPMLWCKKVGNINMRAAYTTLSNNLGEAEPTKNTQIALPELGDLTNYSILCYTRPLCFRDNSFEFRPVMYHWMFNCSGSTLQGRWARTYKALAVYPPSIRTGEYSACSRVNLLRDYALIDNTVFN